jgi:hypothetical protein
MQTLFLAFSDATLFRFGQDVFDLACVANRSVAAAEPLGNPLKPEARNLQDQMQVPELVPEIALLEGF